MRTGTVQERARPLQAAFDLSAVRVSMSMRKVGAVVLAAVVSASGWTWGCVKDTGKDVAGAVVSDYVKVHDEVTTLKAQRVEDVRTHDRERQEDAAWKTRVDRQLGEILQALGARRR